MRPSPPSPLVLEYSPSTRLESRFTVVLLAALLAMHVAMGPFAVPTAREAMNFVVVGVVFWGALLTLMIAERRRVLRHHLEIDENGMTFHGERKTPRVNFKDVQRIAWLPNEAHLALAGGNRWINVAKYPEQFRLELLRRIRNGVPLDHQTGWESAFRRTVLPLLLCKLRPDHGELVVTRRRWDAIFGAALLPASAIGLFNWYVLEQVRMCFLPALLVALWLLMRRSTPRRGEIAPAFVDAPRGDLRGLLLVAGLLLLPFLGIAVHALLGEPVPGLTTALLFAALMMFPVLFYLGLRHEKNNTVRLEQQQAELLTQFDWITGWPHEIDFERERGADESA